MTSERWCGVHPPEAASAPLARRPRAWLFVAAVLVLATGLAGFALGSRQVDRGMTAAQRERAPVTGSAPAPPAAVEVEPTATSACVETARRADELIRLLTANKRERAAQLLVAYTVASRQCRQDASP